MNGFNATTTSIAEGMHSSMKSGGGLGNTAINKTAAKLDNKVHRTGGRKSNY